MPHSEGEWTVALQPLDKRDYPEGGRVRKQHGDYHFANYMLINVPVKDMAEALANARLMAAAPKLLETIKQLQEFVDAIPWKKDDSINIPCDGVIMRNVRGAILEALGQPR